MGRCVELLHLASPGELADRAGSATFGYVRVAVRMSRAAVNTSSRDAFDFRRFLRDIRQFRRVIRPGWAEAEAVRGRSNSPDPR